PYPRLYRLPRAGGFLSGHPPAGREQGAGYHRLHRPQHRRWLPEDAGGFYHLELLEKLGRLRREEKNGWQNTGGFEQVFGPARF
ncbi:MAG: hypothetical protein RMK65_10635, partial [Anaerolineae bacterium]|nr:hypothetical protein [Anaerolineae bacterium]